MSEQKYWVIYTGEITKKINNNTFVSFTDDVELLEEYNAWVSEGNEATYVPSPEESMGL